MRGNYYKLSKRIYHRGYQVIIKTKKTPVTQSKVIYTGVVVRFLSNLPKPLALQKKVLSQVARPFCLFLSLIPLVHSTKPAQFPSVIHSTNPAQFPSVMHSTKGRATC